MFPRPRNADAWLDGAVAVGLAAVGGYEIWLGDAMEALPRPVASVVWLLLAVSFGWRRRAPIVPVAAVVGNVAAFGLAAGPEPPSAQVFVAALLAFYSAGAHGAGRVAVVGAAIAGAVIVGLDLYQVATGTEGTWAALGAWILIATAWVAGRTIRLHRVGAAELERRATRLESEREERARQAVAEERARMARELHDVVTHSVGVMVVQAQAGQRLLRGDEPGAREAFSAIESAGRTALAEMRRLLGLLRPTEEAASLAPLPGIERLDPLIEQVRRAGLPVELRIEGEARRLPPGIELSTYRIVQEALTNALKHAAGANALVVLAYGPDRLEIEVLDNGASDGHGGEPGQGLVGMRERVALLGGNLESGPRTNGGFRVRASLPLGPADA